MINFKNIKTATQCIILKKVKKYYEILDDFFTTVPHEFEGMVFEEKENAYALLNFFLSPHTVLDALVGEIEYEIRDYLIEIIDKIYKQLHMKKQDDILWNIKHEMTFNKPQKQIDKIIFSSKEEEGRFIDIIKGGFPLGFSELRDIFFEGKLNFYKYIEQRNFLISKID